MSRRNVLVWIKRIPNIKYASCNAFLEEKSTNFFFLRNRPEFDPQAMQVCVSIFFGCEGGSGGSRALV